MKEYHKIDSLFKRDMGGSKRLIIGEYRDPLVEYLKDNEWIFTEKIDGTNIRIMWDGHKVIFGGRTENAQIPANLIAVLQEKFLTREVEEIFEEKFGEVEVVLFGEGFGEKIQKGGGLYGKVDFILFDVLVGDIFLERENVEDIAIAFAVRVVPIIYIGTIEQAISIVKSNLLSTTANEDKQIEGLIGTPKQRIYDAKKRRIIVKIKCKDF